MAFRSHIDPESHWARWIRTVLRVVDDQHRMFAVLRILFPIPPSNPPEVPNVGDDITV